MLCAATVLNLCCVGVLPVMFPLRSKGTWRGYSAGDTRWAIAPFLAHQHYGDSYKWMIFGDDDTLYFMDNLRRCVCVCARVPCHCHTYAGSISV